MEASPGQGPGPARWKGFKRDYLIAAGLLTIALILVGWLVLRSPPDVRNQDVGFEAEAKPGKVETTEVETIDWPMFGFDRARTRNLQLAGLRPPFKKIWNYEDGTLLEFPPIYADGRLYLIDNDARLKAFDPDTGRIIWRKRVGRLNASSPAYADGYLYVVNLEPGHVMKIDAESGRRVWMRDLPGRSESSPVVKGNTVYFGCENGQLFAMDTRNGRVRWATFLGGEIKSAPAMSRGMLFVGDYGGNMNAVNARTGKIKWQSGSLGSGFGTGGAFYSTPAVAFGRVYAGNNDGRVYSYDTRDGTLAWSHSTGGYVYSGPAVTSTDRTPPTVYIGSFDGNIYALNAKSGETRWSRAVGGQVIGSLTVIGEIVYIAEFTNTTTLGYDTKNGRQVFRYKTGTYTPVISDGRRIYLTGYSSLNALEPVKRRVRDGSRARQGEAGRKR